MEYSQSSYQSLPTRAGVYVFLDKNRRVLYVGKAIDIKARVSSYFTSPAQLGEKTRVMVSQVQKIKVTFVETELEALLLEAYYVKKYQPKYNIRLTDNKSYLLIRITLGDKYPKVLLARREEDPKSLYFGPYPSSSSVKLVLKTIRRVFPYQSVPNHAKRICLYHHLGLCPCPEMFDSPQMQKEYKKNIHGVIKILEGGSKKLMVELEKERDRSTKSEHYEDSLVSQKKIRALSVITTPFHRPFEYDVNPNLRIDIRMQEMNELMDALNKHGYELHSLHRIECYDISNTQGVYATGSMVVFTDGEKDSSQYRRFKIKKDGKPNDFAMMKEVLKRRFHHEGWDRPDLVIVDGGKGQVSSALEVFLQNNIQIPLIGLAKREETIVIPNASVQNASEENFTEVLLPKDSKGSLLIRRIRDEAHRFAITYHRKLRSKAMTVS